MDFFDIRIDELSGMLAWFSDDANFESGRLANAAAAAASSDRWRTIGMLEAAYEYGSAPARYAVMRLLCGLSIPDDPCIAKMENLVSRGLLDKAGNVQEQAVGLAEHLRTPARLKSLEQYATSLDKGSMMEEYVSKVIAEIRSEIG